ncbi:MAG: hypothetical protein QOC97_378 [Chloroflexota bacterium]|jgi:hypothetical protein|nr:hypothetical protein [Chloroflexota bacterium]
MAQTDTRPGFRLPWTAERSDSDQPAEETVTETPVAEETSTAEELEKPDMIDTTAAAATDTSEAMPGTPTASPAPSAKRPTKFMADLSRAMQAAAESSRDDTMARVATDAKTAVEQIHAASTDEAAALRRNADDDVAAVREWSKAEIARIREEAEVRVAARKVELDAEMELHGRVVEARVEQVNSTVSEFEGQMLTFFERLMAEQDPTRIATMAEAMPDPPDLLEVAASITEPLTALPDPVVSEPAPEPTAETTESTATTADEAPEAVADATPEAVADPRLEALGEAGLEFAAAEAEAAAFTGDIDDDEVPAAPEGDHPENGVETAETAPEAVQATTRVVVLGLVSVASIATFKRTLGRVTGISAIGVASGPDGEFVFTVSHDAGLGLGDAITALPGFEARVTAETAEGLEVAAHDPDVGP